MVDACRDNPLKAKGRSVGHTRGLSAIEPPKGQMVVYSASKGQQALDRLSERDSNPNSVFTREFISRMKKPGVRIEDLVREVQDAVEALAGTVKHEQRPALYNEARGNFYFFGPTTVQTAPGKPDSVASDAQIEQQAWAAAQSGNTAAGYSAYLDEYPKGRFAAAARVARASLVATPAVAPVATPVMSQPISPTAQTAAGQIIKDCADCPELVVIPVGSFLMGASDRPDGSEGPVHEVRIGRALAMGRYEVTRGEFARFVNASGYKTLSGQKRSPTGCMAWDGKRSTMEASKSWRDPGFTQTDSHPVVCVSWYDAQAYLAWLNEKAPGKGFRLPTEAEWEYAARAGQGTARYPWGDDPSYSQICDFANGMDATAKAQFPDVTWTAASCSDGHANTAPVGSFKANAFGLYDMHGNAGEWVQDVWHENYQGAPDDGSAWVNGGDQNFRQLRGGTFRAAPMSLRSAGRRRLQPELGESHTGLRIVRTN